MKKNRIIPILCAVILSAVVLTSVIAAASLPNRQNGNGGASDTRSDLSGGITADVGSTDTVSAPRAQTKEERIAVVQSKITREDVWADVSAKIATWDNSEEAARRFEEFKMNHTCREGVICTHMPSMYWLRTGNYQQPSDPVSIHFSQIASEYQAYIDAEKKREECTHENGLVFHDTDTGAYSLVCPDCAAKRTISLGDVSSEANADSEVGLVTTRAITTNSVLTSGCAHTYTDWIWYTTTQHVRICTKCSAYSYGSHSIVEADCVTFRHCTICNGRDSSWQIAYGHELAYDFDWDAWDFENESSYYHFYRCVRKDDYLEPICDYVISRSACDFTARYWDPAVNGKHEVYHVCPYCIITFYENDAVCEAANGRTCSYCLNPNPFN